MYERASCSPCFKTNLNYKTVSVHRLLASVWPFCKSLPSYCSTKNVNHPWQQIIIIIIIYIVYACILHLRNTYTASIGNI